jgi:TonB-linked SusC/RagA family outer membrane protein
MNSKSKFCQWCIFSLMLLLPSFVNAQTKVVRGSVADASTGEALIGASVLVKGASTGTVTDINGNFSLELSGHKMLTVSYVGYQTKEVTVTSTTNLRIELDPDSKTVDEVVVIAYGQQKKVTVTGSISNVSGKELLKSPVASLGNALAGKLPGVSTVQYSGAPGADDPNIFIRGQASLNGSNPLVLVDGVERSFTQIDPNEVADITVLKDASATAVYGVRGANGVILVTTKRGEEGKTHISASTSWGLQAVTKFIEFADSYTYAKTFNQARITDGNNPRFSDETLEHFKNHDQPLIYPDVNWIDYMMKDVALQSQHNISVSGGNKVARYFVSLGMLDQDGLFKTLGSDPKSNFSYQRYNFRANLDLNLGKWHQLSVNIGGRV